MDKITRTLQTNKTLKVIIRLGKITAIREQEFQDKYNQLFGLI